MSDVLTGYLTEPELAEELGVTRRTLRTWQARRIGPPRTVVGRRPLYRRDAVADWLREREQAPVRRARG